MTVIMGGLGSGKTLFATYVASKSEDPVYSNYVMRLPKYNALTPMMLPDILGPALIVIDEAYAWLESRTSGKDVNRYLSYILFQSRKRGLNFMVTLQLLGTMDVRFRELADYYIVAERFPSSYRYTFIDRARNRTKKIGMPEAIAEKIYPLYDTMEQIAPPNDMAQELSLADPGDIQTKLNELVDHLLSQAPLEKWTKGAIADICLELRFPKSYANMAYDRVKRMQITTKGS